MSRAPSFTLSRASRWILALGAPALAAAAIGCSNDVSVAGTGGTTGAGGSSTVVSSTSASSAGGSPASGSTTNSSSAITTGAGGSSSVTTGAGGSPPVCDPATLDTDPHNCGVCGHDCLGGACAASACQSVTVFQEGGQPWAIDVDDKAIYWLNNQGTLERTSKTVPTGADLLAGGLVNTGMLRVDSGVAYWSQYDHPLGVQAVKVTGGVITVFGDQGLGGFSLALDPVNVYWTSITDWGGGVGDIMKTPRAGGPMTVMVPGQHNPGVAASDGAHLYFTLATYPGQMPPPAAKGGIRRVTVSGNFTVEDVVTSDSVYSVALDQDHCYWVYGGSDPNQPIDAAIRRIAKGGGAPEQVVALGYGGGSLAVDEAYVYWTSSASHTVSKAKKDGGPEIVLSQGGNPTSMAIDESAVYWVDPVQGTVNKVAK